MPKIDQATLAKFVMLGLKVISTRLLTWATMLITACGFGYVMYDPNPIRLAAATIFSLLIFWRVTWVEKREEPKGETPDEP